MRRKRGRISKRKSGSHRGILIGGRTTGVDFLCYFLVVCENDRGDFLKTETERGTRHSLILSTNVCDLSSHQVSRHSDTENFRAMLSATTYTGKSGANARYAEREHR